MANNTSGTYNFQQIQTEVLIREAYENIGVLGDNLVAQQLDIGRRGINFILLEWTTKGVSLWTRTIGYIGLVENKSKYILPNYVRDIRHVNTRTFTRQLSGYPSAMRLAGGVIADGANAFDNNSETAFRTNLTDAYLIYDYGRNAGGALKANNDNSRTRVINFIGVETNETKLYRDLVIEYSQDPESNDPEVQVWNTLLTIEERTFNAGEVEWFDVPVPVRARAYRLAPRNPDQASTLRIRELYLGNNTSDIQVSLVSRDEYIDYSNKTLTSRPTTFYLDRQIQPELYLWPAPNRVYNCLQYTYQRMIQDVGLYTETLEIPSRFYPALILALSTKLALKFQPERYQLLKEEYERVFEDVNIEDSERTSFTIMPDYGGEGR